MKSVYNTTQRKLKKIQAQLYKKNLKFQVIKE